MALRQGAFKTPGGKLVAVDFNVEDGKLRDVKVHGDFFLEPEDALGRITQSLNGIPADLPTGEIAERISRAIPPDVEWLGSSPEALAMAVRRGLDEPADDAAGGGNRGFS